MITYSFTQVAVVVGNTDYARNSTGTADGPDQGSAREINVRCNLKKPPVTTRSQGRNTPVYTITGVNPSGEHEVFTATCEWNNDAHWGPTTACRFSIS